MEKVIFEAINVCKRVGNNLVLDNVSFRFTDQSAVAILGQNGSGKSTLLKILAGIYEPTSGIMIRNSKRIGYVPEHFPVNLRFKLKEYLLMMTSIQGLPVQRIESELMEYVRMFHIEPFIDMPLKQCSKGTKQKAGIIQALLMKPKILILDEPLTGLDTAAQHNLISLLEAMKKHITIIFTTHENIMMEKLADQILNIGSGKISFTQEQRKYKKIIKVTFLDKEIFKELNLTDIHFEGTTALFEVDSDFSDQILMSLLNRKCSVLEVRKKGAI